MDYENKIDKIIVADGSIATIRYKIRKVLEEVYEEGYEDGMERQEMH
ncbi:MAG: hypothetical protein AMQ74_01681 [Candidatus Methanofastidiosum methylothiophilum]|uniref:Uncharacterized protein n=1 Tax=Candidatus Methanofastidiosum methylothiophilum TaxID=1705564 RepID=A0A150IQW1_9EURY|nr:MAG: hypothetical protein AMQ74_01681 [Candidatus Methanofastidiosum methylthiophilus]